MLAVEEDKVVVVVERRSRSDIEEAEEKDEEVKELWSEMGMVEDGGWKLEVLDSDNGRVVRL